MHARVTTVQLQPGAIDQAVEIWRKSVLASAQMQPGFKEVLVLGDRATNKGYAITLWETEADLEASATGPYLRQTMAEFAPLFAGEPTQETLEVLLQKERYEALFQDQDWPA